jgi:DNA-binding XRE family transcriptional regulator
MKAHRQKLLTELLAMGKDIKKHTRGELAKMYGVSRYRIRDLGGKLPYKPHPRRPYQTEVVLGKLTAMGKDIENYSQAELARLLGVTRDDIHSVVRQVPKYQPRPRWTKDTRNLTEKLLAMGKAVEDYSQTELARKFHVPRKTVANRVPGLLYKPKGRPPEYGNAWKRIFALGKAVCSLNEAELARKVGVTRERIRQLRPTLVYKPFNCRENYAHGYSSNDERAFLAFMRREVDYVTALTDRRGDDECWPWLGTRSGRYGTVPIGRNQHDYVHRVVYQQEYGPIPKGYNIIHRCRDGMCVNPRHVLAVDRRTIVLWTMAGGRWKISEGVRRLTPKKLRAIKVAYALLPKFPVVKGSEIVYHSNHSESKKLAARFGVPRHLLPKLAKSECGNWITLELPPPPRREAHS